MTEMERIWSFFSEGEHGKDEEVAKMEANERPETREREEKLRVLFAIEKESNSRKERSVIEQEEEARKSGNMSLVLGFRF